MRERETEREREGGWREREDTVHQYNSYLQIYVCLHSLKEKTVKQKDL